MNTIPNEWLEEYEPYLVECFKLLIRNCHRHPQYPWQQHFNAFCRLMYQKS
jgi:hypothetical protein